MKNPKFKVGDRVRILDPSAKEVMRLERGAVIEVGKHLRRYLISARFGYPGWAWWIKERDLELVQEGPKGER